MRREETMMSAYSALIVLSCFRVPRQSRTTPSVVFDPGNEGAVPGARQRPFASALIDAVLAEEWSVVSGVHSRWTHNAGVEGSSPSLSTNNSMAWWR